MQEKKRLEKYEVKLTASPGSPLGPSTPYDINERDKTS